MATEDPRTPISPAVIRRLLRQLLPTDSHWRAFCVDYFFNVYRNYFGEGVSRGAQENILLSFIEPSVILARLYEQGGVAQVNAALVNIGARPQPSTYDSLQERLVQLASFREHLRLSNKDTSALDAQIVNIQRQQRQRPQLHIGDMLASRYQLLRIIGRGRFAIAWQATDRQTLGPVVAKVLNGELTKDWSLIERFRRGASHIRVLHHPHIVRVFDGPAEYEGFHYFVMEYLPGQDLQSAVLEQGMDRAAALSAVLQVGSAIEYLHSQGLIHRDIRPKNILFDSRGSARLIGFDLTASTDVEDELARGGTLAYVAPELTEVSRTIDHRADLYSLAVTVIFVLHGKTLTLRAVVDRVALINHLDCPEAVRELLRSATSFEPGERPSTVAEFCRELQNALAQTTSQTAPPGRSEPVPVPVTTLRPGSSPAPLSLLSHRKGIARSLDALNMRTAVGLGVGGGLAVSVPMVWSGHWLGFAGLAGIIGAAAWLTQTGEAVAVPLVPQPVQAPEVEPVPSLFPQPEQTENRVPLAEVDITQRRILSEVATRLGRERQWHELTFHSQTHGHKLILLPGERGQGHSFFMMRIELSLPREPRREIVSVLWARKPVPPTRKDMMGNLASALRCSSELLALRDELYRRLMRRSLVLLHPIIWEDFDSSALRLYYEEWLPELLDSISAPFGVKIIQPIEWSATSAQTQIAAMLIGWLFRAPPQWVRRTSQTRRARALISELGRHQHECLPVYVLPELESIKPEDVRNFSRVLEIPDARQEKFVDAVLSGARDTNDIIENLINHLPYYKRD